MLTKLPASIYRTLCTLKNYLLNPYLIIKHGSLLLTGYKIFNGNILKLFKYAKTHTNSFPTALNILSFKDFIPPNTIIDFGANSSQMIRLLTLKNENCEILSFEPNSKLKPMGKVFNLALSNKKNKVFFSINPSCDGVTSQIVKQKDEYTIELETTRFDSLVQEKKNSKINFQDLPHPILLKVDVEGHTKEVLEGMGIYLKKVDAVLVEIDNTSELPDIYSLLNKNGFKNSKIIYSWTSNLAIPVYFDVYFWK